MRRRIAPRGAFALQIPWRSCGTAVDVRYTAPPRVPGHTRWPAARVAIQDCSAMQIIFQRLLFSGGFANIHQLAVGCCPCEDGAPGLVDARLIRSRIQPAVLDASQHGRGNHSGRRVFRVRTAPIDHLAPHAVRVLKSGKRAHVILERPQHSSEFRVLAREVGKRPGEAERRKGVPASPSCFIQG